MPRPAANQEYQYERGTARASHSKSTFQFDQPISPDSVFSAVFKTINCYLSSISLTKIVLTAAIAITAIIISSVYRDECPAEPKLSTWCLTFGLVLIGLFVLNALLKLAGFAQNSCQANGICLYIVAILLSTFILMLLLFAFGWLITGMVWTYSIRNRLTFSDRRLMTHCEPQFYFFLFWGLAALMLFLIVSLVFKLFNYAFKFCSELSSDDCAFF